MKESSKCYAIVVTRKDGTKFFASGENQWFAHQRSWHVAQAHKRALNDHMGRKCCKVVKATLTIESES